ncbi:MAG: alpha/beta hydrolase, partial [Clostridiaceae bacterium]|nr:alpha/beta hydrolase [Clostridiaceae bacterium]
MRELLNIPYSKYYTDERVVDLFIPDEVKSDKCIFFIHGGGFHAGKKDAWHPLARWFCERGFVSCSMEYRLAPGDTAGSGSFQEGYKRHFPAQIEDVRLCMSYLKENASKYGYDKDKIIVAGSSAGAYLCGMLLTIPKEDMLGYTAEMTFLDTTPYGAVLYCPVLDLHYNDLTIYGYEISCNQNFMGKPIEGNEELYKIASPVYRITGKEAPCLVIHAAEDKLVTKKAVDNMMDAFKKHGVSAELVLVEGAAHG